MAGIGWFFLNVGQGIFVAVWSILWIAVALLLRPFSHETSVALSRWCWAPALVGITGARVTVLQEGPPLEPSRPCIFVMNHQSILDIPLAMACLPVNLRFIAKSSIRWVPFLGWYIGAMGMIFIDRRNHAEALQSLDVAARRIREGVNLLAFPEGTRSLDGSIQPLKKGVFITAIQAGVPLVPVVAVGPGKVLPPGGFRIRPGDIHVAIGPAIDASRYSMEQRDELVRDVRARMTELHGALASRQA